jgi:hypothetical protein
MFVIVHSGQTGVERGAHDGAVSAGFKVMGFMASNRRDELGLVPPRIAAHLAPSVEAGPRSAVKANLAIADAVMLVVPDADVAEQFPAIDWIVKGARSLRLPMLICDAHTNIQRILGWSSIVRGDRADLRLLVTGPRATRWPVGEGVARRLVRSLGVSF